MVSSHPAESLRVTKEIWRYLRDDSVEQEPWVYRMISDASLAPRDTVSGRSPHLLKVPEAILRGLVCCRS